MRNAASLGDKLALGYLPNKQLKVARQMKSSISETTMEKQENDLVSSAFRKNTPKKVSPVPLGVFFMGLGAGIGGGLRRSSEGGENVILHQDIRMQLNPHAPPSSRFVISLCPT